MPPAMPTTPREEVDKLEASGMSRQEIGRRTGVAQTTLRRWYGAKDWDNAHPPETREAVAKLVEAGLTYQSIERETGVSWWTIYRWHGPSKHSISDAIKAAQEKKRREYEARYKEMVRLRMKEGLSNRQISERMGVAMSAVARAMGRTPGRISGVYFRDPGLRERAMYLKACDWTVTEISEEMGVPRSTVGGWVNASRCQ